jgi:alpha-L-arabinofuranosidase
LNAYIDAIRRVDPTVKILADGGNPEVARRIRRDVGNRVDYIVDHLYAPWEMKGFERDGKPYPMEKLTQAEVWNAWTSFFVTDPRNRPGMTGLNVIDHAAEHRYPIAVTEWNFNGWWGPDAWRVAPLDSQWAKGVGAAGMLHMMMRHADKVKIATMSNTVGHSWEITAIHVDPKGEKPAYYMPTGQVVALYSAHHGNRLLDLRPTKPLPTFAQPFKVNGHEPAPKVASLDMVASAGPRAVFLHAINRSFDKPTTLTVDLRSLKGFTGAGTVHRLTGRLVNAPKPGEPQGTGTLSHIPFRFDTKTLRLTLPARTVQVIELPRK